MDTVLVPQWHYAYPDCPDHCGLSGSWEAECVVTEPALHRGVLVRRVYLAPGEVFVCKFDGSNCSHHTYGYVRYVAPAGHHISSVSWDNTDNERNDPDVSGYGRGKEVYRCVPDDDDIE